MPRFESPVGSQDDRNAGKIWPENGWWDAQPFGEEYTVKGSRRAVHTGADLNSDGDDSAPVFAMGDGKVTYAAEQYHIPPAWGGLIVIYHGLVDGRHIYSRYGHVRGVAVELNQTVRKGDHIARVGNGGPLLNFDPHLHFDISNSPTRILSGDPGYWPGLSKDLVLMHFVKPKTWLYNHIQAEAADPSASTGRANVGVPAPAPMDADTELRFVIHSNGAQVRKEHRTAAEVVHELKHGASLSVMKGGGMKQDGFIWAKISGGEFHGYWVPVCTADEKEFYLSKKPPA
jgi:Peptidase family M23